jgi:RNA polymerase sigma-70 factor (ECF subfamily)
MSRLSAPLLRLHPHHPKLADLPPAASAPEAPEWDDHDPQVGQPGSDSAPEETPPALALHSAEEIFHQHLPRIYSLARRMLGNETDIEDVVQEVLLQVVRKLGSFRGQAEVTTWLHRVTVNCALLHRRRNAPTRARQVWAPVEEVVERGRASNRQERPDQRVLAEETQNLIELAISRLPEMYRDPFVLSDIEGLANAEIGEALGLSLAAVKSRLHRARMLLRDALAPHFRERNPQ